MEEISRREKQAGIKPEADVDAFMKATSLGGVKSSIATDYILRVSSHIKTFASHLPQNR
jgi:hypothetical protein